MAPVHSQITGLIGGIPRTLTELAQHLSRDELTAFGIPARPAIQSDETASF